MAKWVQLDRPTRLALFFLWGGMLFIAREPIVTHPAVTCKKGLSMWRGKLTCNPLIILFIILYNYINIIISTHHTTKRIGNLGKRPKKKWNTLHYSTSSLPLSTLAMARHKMQRTMTSWHNTRRNTEVDRCNTDYMMDFSFSSSCLLACSPHAHLVSSFLQFLFFSNLDFDSVFFSFHFCYVLVGSLRGKSKNITPICLISVFHFLYSLF